jgi:membrane fusion protein (multidrug efflux system)
MMHHSKFRTISTFFLVCLLGLFTLSCGGDKDSAGKPGKPGTETADGASADPKAKRPRTKGERPGGRPGSKGKRPGRPGGQHEAAAVPVMTTRTLTDDMEAFLDGSSTLYAEETVDVVSQATGVVVEVLAEEGAQVRKGEVLVRLAYEELELAEQRARSEHERLKANFTRAENLSMEQLITEEDYQQVRFDLARAEIDWQQARLDLQHTRILAPIAGTITTRTVRVGQLVRENDTVHQIVDFSSLVAPVYIPEKYIASLRVGQPAFLTTPAMGDDRINGTVLRVSPVVDSQSGTVKVTIDLKGNPGLRPGMFAEVQLVLDRHEGVVVIEKRAIIYDDELPHVFVVVDGKVERRRIELGYQDETRAEVLTGVEAGEEIVVVGQSALKDGSAVTAGNGNRS